MVRLKIVFSVLALISLVIYLRVNSKRDINIVDKAKQIKKDTSI